MKFRAGYSWVYVETDSTNKTKIRFEESDGYYDSKSMSVSFTPEEWEKLKKAGDLVNAQVQAQAAFEAELNG